jgi:DNA-directed RNA polymerase subunit delta
MIRKIVDYQKLNEDILNLLVEKFPDGYADKDIIAFRNAQNEYIEAVEVRTEDTSYLVKVGKRLVQAMEEHEEEEHEDDLDNDNPSHNHVDIDSLNDEDLD